MPAPPRRISWVQRLDLPETLRLLLLGLFSARAIRYDAARITPAAARVLSLLARLGFGAGFAPWRLVGDRQDAAGRCLYYRKYEIMALCMERLQAGIFPGEPDWFSRALAAYLSEQPYRFVAHIQDETAALPDAEHEINISFFPASAVIAAHYSLPGCRIRSQFDLAARFKAYALPFIYVGRALLRQTSARTPEPPAQRPCIWVEWGGCGSWLAFWRKALRAQGFDLAYCFDLDTLPLDEAARRRCTEEDMLWVDNRRDRLARLSGRDLLEVAQALRSRLFREPLWIACFRGTFAAQVCISRSIFRRFQVKAFMQHHDTVWKPQAQMLALEQAGGIMVGFHWSFGPFLEPYYMGIGHAYFVWGRYMRDCLDHKGHGNRHILPSGLWLDASLSRGDVPGLRAGPAFTLAVFDASVEEDIYTSPAALSRFYRAALDLLEAQPSWGAYFKPKNLPREGLRRLPSGEEISERLGRLEDAGRALYLGTQLTPPAVAARADLTLSFSLQTAAVLAGAHGRRVVIWDAAGMLDEPFYRDSSQRFLFKTLQETMRAVQAAAAGDPSVGDFSGWRRAFDHFEDSGAAQRVAAFLRDYMDGLRGRTAMEALDSAAQAYTEANGVGGDFAAGNVYWPPPLRP